MGKNINSRNVESENVTIITNLQNSYSPEIVYMGGKLMAILLIISLIIAYLVKDTKYFNKQISETLSAYSNPLLLVFILIMIFKIILII